MSSPTMFIILLYGCSSSFYLYVYRGIYKSYDALLPQTDTHLVEIKETNVDAFSYNVPSRPSC